MKQDYEIAIIGSGFLGMNMAIQLLKENITNFVILEQSTEVGGVWRDNSYPGAACDIPSHLYSLKDVPNPNWSELYSGRKEIYEYLQSVADKKGLRKYIEFNARTTSASFDSKTNCWTIGLANGKSLTVQVIIPALGPLNVPSYPKIEGIDSFEGIKVHTSEWDVNMEIEHKKIAIIGTGASAIQAIPHLAKAAEKLTVFQRTAPWILPKLKGEYTASKKERFKKHPILMTIERERIFWRQEMLHFLFKKPGGLFSNQGKKFALSYLNRKIKDPELRAKVTPNFTIGCKRLLQTNTYYPALTRDNVSVITDSVVKITKDSLITKDGTEIKADIIVFGTGFHAGDVSGMNITTKSNRDILDVWNGVPRAYKGTVTFDCPNAFFLLGPNTGLGHNSVIHIGETQASYIMQCLMYMRKNNYKSIEVKKDAEDSYVADIYKQLESSVWQSGGCASWYQNEDGINYTLWPNSCTSFRKELKKVQLSDFTFN